MGKIMMTASAMAMFAFPVFADGKTFSNGCNAGCMARELASGKVPNNPENLRRFITEVNIEDQRLVEMTFDPDTYVLRGYTQDMASGTDGDISRREVAVDLSALKGADGADGADGAPGEQGAQGTQGERGEKGDRGEPGRDGRDGVDAPVASIFDQMSSDRALAGIQTRTPLEGAWTGSIALSGTQDDITGIGAAARYGVSESSDLYIGIGQSFDGATSWSIGMAWDF